MQIDLTKYAPLNSARFSQRDAYEVNDVEEAVREEEEEADDRLYLDQLNRTFRFHDPILEEQNTDPQYWSLATLRTWRERVCYD
jgi:hypothetical protein